MILPPKVVPMFKFEQLIPYRKEKGVHETIQTRIDYSQTSRIRNADKTGNEDPTGSKTITNS